MVLGWTESENCRNQREMPRVTKLDAMTLASLGGPDQPAATARPAGGDDRSLVSRAKANDTAAFEELVERHKGRVFAVATGILRQREDVEDVVQQVFLKAYFALKRFDQRAAFSTWLYKITVNECWDLLRKRKVRPLLYEADLNEEQARSFLAAGEAASTQPDASQRLESRQRLEQLLSCLDEQDRTMMILKEAQGFSVEEIGAILDLNTNTVKVRLFRARRKLAERMRRKKI